MAKYFKNSFLQNFAFREVVESSADSYIKLFGAIHMAMDSFFDQTDVEKLYDSHEVRLNKEIIHLAIVGSYPQPQICKTRYKCTFCTPLSLSLVRKSEEISAFECLF